MIRICEHVLEGKSTETVLFVDAGKVIGAMCDACQPRFNEFIKPLYGLDKQINRRVAVELGIPTTLEDKEEVNWFVTAAPQPA